MFFLILWYFWYFSNNYLFNSVTQIIFWRYSFAIKFTCQPLSVIGARCSSIYFIGISVNLTGIWLFLPPYIWDIYGLIMLAISLVLSKFLLWPVFWWCSNIPVDSLCSSILANIRLLVWPTYCYLQSWQQSIPEETPTKHVSLKRLKNTQGNERFYTLFLILSVKTSNTHTNIYI